MLLNIYVVNKMLINCEITAKNHYQNCREYFYHVFNYYIYHAKLSFLLRLSKIIYRPLYLQHVSLRDIIGLYYLPIYDLTYEFFITF